MIPAVAIPALIALVADLVLLGYSISLRAKHSAASLTLALLVILGAQSAVEFVGFQHFVHHGLTPTLQRIGFAYMALAICAIAVIFHASLRLGVEPRVRIGFTQLQLLIYLPALALLALLLFSDQLVVGFRPFHSTVLRVPGRFYFLFELYVIVYSVMFLASLVYGVFFGKDSPVHRARAQLWLLGLLPTGLLFIYLIIANHFGWAKLTSTIYAPITLTLFLVIATYAICHHRLVDIKFYIPWSKVRKQKKELYRRLQQAISEIVNFQSPIDVLGEVAGIFNCQITLIGGSSPVVVFPTAEMPRDDANSSALQFPPVALQDVNQIVVADEIQRINSELYSLMEQYKVDAIAPCGLATAPNQWILLGERFRDQIYTPRDFKMMEALLGAIRERFTENSSVSRSLLAEATDDLRRSKYRLSSAWDELVTLRQKVAFAELENHRLRAIIGSELQADDDEAREGVRETSCSEQKTLEQFLAELEAALVVKALQQCSGDLGEAARLLGVTPHRLQYLIERHRPRR